MKLVFSLEYRTDWGQDLRVEVTLKRKRGADVRRVYPLHTDDGLNWTGEALVTEKDIERFCTLHHGMVEEMFLRCSH